MDTRFKERFINLWTKYFPTAELPIGFYYSHQAEPGIMAKIPTGFRCLIGDLIKVRKGEDLCLNAQTMGCGGGRRYCGFEETLMPDFQYFLSYGIPGKLEGERYKKSPKLVEAFLEQKKPLQAPAPYLIFKRWDRLSSDNEPLVLIFFATPDVLAGLFTLANFDEPGLHGVIAPFGAGCASIIDYPYGEINSSHPRAILGMFDVSARPYVPSHVLTMAVCYPKFVRMVDNMEESFLIGESWRRVRSRDGREAE